MDSAFLMIASANADFNNKYVSILICGYGKTASRKSRFHFKSQQEEEESDKVALHNASYKQEEVDQGGRRHEEKQK